MRTRTFDAKVWSTGIGLVITVPHMVSKVLEIKKGDIIEVTIKKEV